MIVHQQYHENTPRSCTRVYCRSLYNTQYTLSSFCQCARVSCMPVGLLQSSVECAMPLVCGSAGERCWATREGCRRCGAMLRHRKLCHRVHLQGCTHGRWQRGSAQLGNSQYPARRPHAYEPCIQRHACTCCTSAHVLNPPSRPMGMHACVSQAMSAGVRTCAHLLARLGMRTAKGGTICWAGTPE